MFKTSRSSIFQKFLNLILRPQVLPPGLPLDFTRSVLAVRTILTMVDYTRSRASGSTLVERITMDLCRSDSLTCLCEQHTCNFRISYLTPSSSICYPMRRHNGKKVTDSDAALTRVVVPNNGFRKFLFNALYY